MMRLPRFSYRAPRTVREACLILDAEGADARVMAGGTDLLPNMKRRQQTPKVVVGLRRVEALSEVRSGATTTLGANVTLAQLAKNPVFSTSGLAALGKAAFAVATPHLRSMGTLGGNLCLDTRCNYYDQSYEWRKAIDFCMKKDGKICWVAPSSPRCWAVSSSDTAPALVALGASATVVSGKETRMVPLDLFFRDDGIHYLNKREGEILTSVHLPVLTDWTSTYLKCRRRGSFDFPILSVAAALKKNGDRIGELRLVLGSVGSRPLVVDTRTVIGSRFSDDVIEELASTAARAAHPLDNTDLNLNWRKRVARDFTAAALREVRGDGPQYVPTGHIPNFDTCGSCH
jgi:4-hydroxybenzoyl-CoA reductase subunit beta